MKCRRCRQKFDEFGDCPCSLELCQKCGQVVADCQCQNANCKISGKNLFPKGPVKLTKFQFEEEFLRLVAETCPQCRKLIHECDCAEISLENEEDYLEHLLYARKYSEIVEEEDEGEENEEEVEETEEKEHYEEEEDFFFEPVECRFEKEELKEIFEKV